MHFVFDLIVYTNKGKIKKKRCMTCIASKATSGKTLHRVLLVKFTLIVQRQIHTTRNNYLWTSDACQRKKKQTCLSYLEFFRYTKVSLSIICTYMHTLHSSLFWLNSRRKLVICKGLLVQPNLVNPDNERLSISAFVYKLKTKVIQIFLSLFKYNVHKYKIYYSGCAFNRKVRLHALKGY